MFSLNKFVTALVLSAMLTLHMPATANAATAPEVRASIITLIGQRIDQLQVEREAALAIYNNTSLSTAEREAARLEYQAICARQWQLTSQSRRIRRLPLNSLLSLEAYLLNLVSPA